MVVRVAALDSTHSLHLSNDVQPSNVPSLCFTQTYHIHHFSQSHNLIGSLSNSVFERRTSTGSELFASLGSGLVETLG